MTQMIVLVLLLFSAIHIMKMGHGDIKILESLSFMTKTARGSETVISFMIIILSSIMGLNAPAILTVGPSFARPLAKKQGISLPNGKSYGRPVLYLVLQPALDLYDDVHFKFYHWDGGTA